MQKTDNLRLVRSRATRKLYRVIRAYQHSIRVTPATCKHGPVFTLDRSQVEGV